MKNINRLLLILFCCSSQVIQAQENKSSLVNKKEKNYFESKWTFGAQLFQGREFYRYNAQDNYYQEDSEHIIKLGLFTNYKFYEDHALQLETNLHGGNGLFFETNLQYEYFFTKKWSVYGGVGLQIAVHKPYESFYTPIYRNTIPKAMLGVRYNASRWITLDLRYENDLLDRYKEPSLVRPSLEKVSTYSLGIQVKF